MSEIILLILILLVSVLEQSFLRGKQYFCRHPADMTDLFIIKWWCLFSSNSFKLLSGFLEKTLFASRITDLSFCCLLVQIFFFWQMKLLLFELTSAVWIRLQMGGSNDVWRCVWLRKTVETGSGINEKPNPSSSLPDQFQICFSARLLTKPHVCDGSIRMTTFKSVTAPHWFKCTGTYELYSYFPCLTLGVWSFDWQLRALTERCCLNCSRYKSVCCF